MLDADQRLAQLTTQLDLDDAQVEQMRPIVEEQTKRQQALFESYSGDRETMRAEMTKLRDETDEQFAEVLTEEQMNKYRELRQQRMRQGRPPGRGN
jgi:Spy/CpxP family protein refolding chaperone